MKKMAIIALVGLVSLLVITSGCVQNQDQNQGENKITVQDDLGNNVTVTGEVERIVSAAPSNTEILFALGQGPEIVGVTEYCDYPSEAKYKEKIGGFQNPSVEKIISMDPDVVFASTTTGEQTVEKLRNNDIPVYVSSPGSISGVIENINEIGKIVGAEDYAQNLTDDMEERIEQITNKVSDQEEKDVFYLMSTYGGTWTAGENTFINQLITKAGGNNIASELKGYKKISLSTVIQKDPDLIITTEHCYTNLGELKNKTGWKELTAVQEGKLYTLEEDQLVRPGPRIIDGLAEVAKTIHPAAFE
ncbi:MAG: ABC-type Fe(3+)-hydroxamate transport system periplasmic component [Candidatus Methanohalarchaeum thermophilum]|uniref:ABC-type Fe(3+)-hydroxamate transport system periplasmic component n=1 Tax=Methanohalarchaeum thermophilum TaxID=1903181 RepID=A0A1Q6DT45_METT1|nr:MAG: ABC-type Fe(3+)-hydroxamate transport system periplasmic component [Candidatus Methanohalarchaeum thermophilum]